MGTEIVSIGVLLQWILNIFMLAGVVACLIKVFRDRDDDPRLTQGLRLLQSKISILEDLSDHSENQVKQLMTLLDKKLREVRATIDQVNQHMAQHINDVDRSMEESRKMAEQIQSEMAPDQIVERKLENKYIQAAQLAHNGHSVNEIVKALGLPPAEVKLITKINKKKCVYPEQRAAATQVMDRGETIQDKIFAQTLEMPEISSGSIDKTQFDFQQAVQDHDEFRSVKLA